MKISKHTNIPVVMFGDTTLLEEKERFYKELKKLKVREARDERDVKEAEVLRFLIHSYPPIFVIINVSLTLSPSQVRSLHVQGIVWGVLDFAKLVKTKQASG